MVQNFVVVYTGSSSEVQRISGLLVKFAEDRFLLVTFFFLLQTGCEVRLKTLGLPVPQCECIDSSRILLHVRMVIEIFKHHSVNWHALHLFTVNTITCGRLFRLFTEFAICVHTLTLVQWMFLLRR